MHFSFLSLLLPLSYLASKAMASTSEQIPLFENPKTASVPETFSPPNSTALVLSDLLTVQNSASIFFSYARETSLGALLSQPGSRLTVLAPVNKAVMALARKPHEGPVPVEEGTIISEEEFDKQSKQNVEKWVSAHIIPQHPIKLLPTSQFETLMEGVVINVEEARDTQGRPQWAQVVLNGRISLISRHEAVNGVLYLIDGTFYG